LCLTLSTVLVMPYLVDRLVAPRLAVMSPLLATFVFPLARVCGEYLIAQLSPAGNIFGSLAATQHGNLPLLQIAAITGSYGVSFLIAWFAAAVNTVWERSATRAQSRTVAVAFIAVLIAVLAGGGIRLAFFPPSAATVRVAGVSPSMAAVAHRDEILRRYSSFDELANAEPVVLRLAFATVNDDLLVMPAPTPDLPRQGHRHGSDRAAQGAARLRRQLSAQALADGRGESAAPGRCRPEHHRLGTESQVNVRRRALESRPR
jgi:apolipoprotein N-acyltransferase